MEGLVLFNLNLGSFLTEKGFRKKNISKKDTMLIFFVRIQTACLKIDQET